YGPMVVAKKPYTVEEIANLKLAIPGRRTTAFLALQLLMRSVGVKELPKAAVVPFDEIIQRVAGGEFEAGLIIHGAQLTYASSGLEKIVALGQGWPSPRGLPLPLGGNAIRRDLAAEFGPICRVLYNSIRYALDNRQAALDYAKGYARD